MVHQPLHELCISGLALRRRRKDGACSLDALDQCFVHLSIPHLAVAVIQPTQRQGEDAANAWQEGVSYRARCLDGPQDLRLGDPAPNAPKWFAAIELIRLAADRDWLSRASREVSKYWRHKRERCVKPRALARTRPEGEIAQAACNN